MASMCINPCIYLWPVNSDRSGAETHFRFRCYRTPYFETMPATDTIEYAIEYSFERRQQDDIIWLQLANGR